MHKYADNMYKYVSNMYQICRYVHKICQYIDFNIANMQIICKEYAQICTKLCKNYANNMQNMHKPTSMYWHILHVYALPGPTLLIMMDHVTRMSESSQVVYHT